MADALHRTYGISYSDIKQRLKVKQREMNIRGTATSRQVGMMLQAVEADLQAAQQALEMQEQQARLREQRAVRETRDLQRLQRQAFQNSLVLTSNASQLNHGRNQMPPLLQSNNVPFQKWQHIYELATKELVPQMQQFRQMQRDCLAIIQDEQRPVSGHGVMALWQTLLHGEAHKRKALKAILATTTAANNVTLVAHKVETVANALLFQSHGILCTVQTQVAILPALQPVSLHAVLGLEFTAFQTESVATPAASPVMAEAIAIPLDQNEF